MTGVDNHPSSNSAEDALWAAAQNGDSAEASRVDSKPGAESGEETQVSGDSKEQSQEAPVSRSLLDALEARNGQKYQFDSDDDFLDALNDGYSRTKSAPAADEIDRLRKMQPVLHEYASEAAEFQEWKKQKQASQEQAKAKQQEEVQKAKWQAPQFSDKTQRLIDGGFITIDPKKGVYSGDPEFAANVKEANDYYEWQRSVSQRLVRDPYALVREAGLGDELTALEARAVERAKKELKEEMAAERKQQQLASDFDKAISEYSDLDAAGKPVIDPQTGHPKWNVRGQAFIKAIQEAQSEFGLTDQSKIFAYARKMANLVQVESKDSDVATSDSKGSKQAAGSQEQQPAKSAAEAKKEKQAAFIDRARTNGKHVNRLENANHQVAKAVASDALENDNDLDSLWRKSASEALEEV